MKNTLAIVQSIALMTFAGDSATAEARVAYEGRLTALAGAHNLLTREHWESVDLGDIVAGALGACHGNQCLTGGPPLRFEPRTAVTVAMAIHELCTNATKYGALSVAGGEVSVRWSIADDNGSPQLTLKWTEIGGPLVTPPTHTGFGTRMIARALRYDLKGDVTLDYLPSGLICTIKAPVPRSGSKAGE